MRVDILANYSVRHISSGVVEKWYFRQDIIHFPKAFDLLSFITGDKYPSIIIVDSRSASYQTLSRTCFLSLPPGRLLGQYFLASLAGEVQDDLYFLLSPLWLVYHTVNAWLGLHQAVERNATRHIGNALHMRTSIAANSWDVTQSYCYC